jgi:hypothetical protein
MGVAGAGHGPVGSAARPTDRRTQRSQIRGRGPHWVHKNLPALLATPHANVSAELFARSVSSKPTVIYRLQHLRAIAAVSVVLCHASYYLTTARGDPWLWNSFARGALFGVMLFFVTLSTMIISIAIDERKPSRRGNICTTHSPRPLNGFVSPKMGRVFNFIQNVNVIISLFIRFERFRHFA